MAAKNTGGWKTCSRGHKYRGPEPCPICYPRSKKRRANGSAVALGARTMLSATQVQAPVWLTQAWTPNKSLERARAR
jgi:hypothetical protein